MIKFTHGWIETGAGKRQNIVVKAAAPNGLKDAMIGGGMVMAGIIYLTYTAFKHGAKAFDKAETITMEELGLLGESTADYDVIYP